MKKRILAMLLSGLLLLSATACQNATGNEIDEPAEGVVVTPGDNGKGDISKDEISSDIQYEERIPGSGVKYRTRWDCNPRCMEIYVEKWEKSFSFEIPENTYIEDALFCEDHIWIVTLQETLHHQIVTLMKLDREGNVIETNTNTQAFDMSDGNALFFNLYNEERLLMMYIGADANEEDSDPPQGKSLYAQKMHWQMEVYKSTDLGKSWEWTGERYGGGSSWRDRLQLFRFFSRDVAFAEFHQPTLSYVDYSVYITQDGGETWELTFGDITSMLYEEEKWYYSFSDLETTEDGYIATFRTRELKTEITKDVRYFSSDLQSWTLIES